MGIISLSLPSDGTTADASDVNTPFTTIANAINGNLDNANIASGAAISGSKLADNSIDLEAKSSVDTGWREVTDSWVYASATTITVPTDATTKYSVGDKIRLTQTTVKYFYVTAVAATTLTISGGTDYTLVNAAITEVSYSKAQSPLGFPKEFNWTPSWTNLTVGDGTLNYAAFSIQQGIIKFKLKFTWGSTTSAAGVFTFSLPSGVTLASLSAGDHIEGVGSFNDANGAKYVTLVEYVSTTTLRLRAQTADSTYVNVSAQGSSATVPFTWVATDIIWATASAFLA